MGDHDSAPLVPRTGDQDTYSVQIRRPAVLVSSAASLPYDYVITVEVLWWYAVIAELYVSSALLAPGLVLHSLTLKHCFNITV